METLPLSPLLPFVANTTPDLPIGRRSVGACDSVRIGERHSHAGGSSWAGVRCTGCEQYFGGDGGIRNFGGLSPFCLSLSCFIFYILYIYKFTYTGCRSQPAETKVCALSFSYPLILLLIMILIISREESDKKRAQREDPSVPQRAVEAVRACAR